MHAILNDLDNFDICLFQDPWWDKIGINKSIDSDSDSVLGSVACPGWQCFVPPGSGSPDVAIYVRSSRSWLSASLSSVVPSCSSVLALDVSVSGFRVCLVCIYVRGSAPSGPVSHLIDFPVDPSVPIIYAGDFNLHHELWSLPDYPTPANSIASDFAEWITSNDIFILNTENTPTRRGLGSQRDSVIDLTLVNTSAAYSNCINDWTCDRMLSFGSDHNGISWTISPPNDNLFVPPEPTYIYPIDLSHRDEWCTEFSNYLATNPLPTTYESLDDLEYSALTLLEAMSEATHVTMDRVKTGSGPQRALWWNDDCRLAVHNVKHCGDDPKDKESARARLRQAIRSAKRNHANDICSSIQVPNLFKLTNWASGKRRSRMPPIKGPNGFATNPDDQANIFRSAFFPTNPPPVDANETFGIHKRNTRPHQLITLQEIQNALDTSSNTSAPGAFGSNYRILKWVFTKKPTALLDFFNGCLNLGYHPRSLKKAVVSVIPKPRRADMSSPKSYRPISLLECLSKCLEKIVTNRIMFDVGHFNLIPFTQFGGRDSSSCTDAGLSLIHDIQSAWKNNKYPSLLTLDISGYFNNINHQRLLNTFKLLGFSNNICNWLGSYLSDRSVSFRIDNHLCTPISLNPVGVPQGSPLSPILSSIYTLPVLLALNDFPNLVIKAYIDDFTILSYSHSFSENAAILSEAVDSVSHVLTKLGLSFEMPKSELIHFARNKAHMANNPNVTLNCPDGSTYCVRALPTVRWLGFHLDRRLDFRDHVKKMATKGLSVIASLRILANCIRGISVLHARLLYKACVMPILTYGAILWYTGTGHKYLYEPLIKAQNAGLRWLLGAFRTSPVSALEHIASIIPIPLAIKRLSENAATRLRTLPPASELAKRLPNTWDTHDPDSPQPARPDHKRPTIIHRLASLSHPEAEHIIPYLSPPWESPHPWGDRLKVHVSRDPADSDERKEYIQRTKAQIASFETDGTLVCYTDGSKRVVRGISRVGAGYSIKHRGCEIRAKSLGLGRKAEVYDAEMWALASAASSANFITHNCPPPAIAFFSDNMAAVQSISSLSRHTAQGASIIFRKAVDDYLTRFPNARVEVFWIPGHSGFTGNERADRLANAGGLVPPNPIFHHTITWSLAHSKRQAVRDWGKSWESARKSAHVSTTLSYKPSWQPSRILRARADADRQTHTRLHQIILGHGFFGEYYNRFVPTEETACPCGEADPQSVRHVLADCSLHDEARDHLRRVSSFFDFTTLFTTSPGLTAVLYFLKDSYAYCK